MRNNYLPRVVQVLGFIFAMALVPAVNALQVVTFSLPDCPSGQTLSFQNNTLSCTGGSPVTTPGSCSISSTPPAATQSGVGVNPGTPVTLTAFCATGNTPITYTWNNLGGVTTNPVDLNAPATATPYFMTPSNDSGPGTTISATVFIAGTQGSAPSNCSISQSPNTAAAPVAAGVNVTLSASCTGGSPVTACSWSNGLSGCSVNVTAPSTTTSYTVTPSNSFGAGPQTTTTVQVQSTNTGGQNFCTGPDQIYTVQWPDATTSMTRITTSGFSRGRGAFKITAPASIGTAIRTGFVRSAEKPGQQATFREFTVSKNACDFQSGNYIYDGMNSPDTGPGGFYSVNNPNGYVQAGNLFNIQPGETVYFNIRNTIFGTPDCDGTCDMIFELGNAR